jgi:hypothetical protein
MLRRVDRPALLLVGPAHASLVALLLGACSQRATPGPGPRPRDAGHDASDAATTHDAAHGDLDAGPDAPLPPRDAGPIPIPRELTCAEAAAARSYMGCEYWPASVPNAVDQSRFSYAVMVGNTGSRIASVTIDGGVLPAARTFTVDPGQTHTEVLPWVEELSYASDPRIVRGGAYHLVSDVPVVVYQFSPLEYWDGLGTELSDYSQTNDASLLLPAAVLSQSYRALVWPTDGGGGAGNITVVATEPGETTVDVRLAGDVRRSFAIPSLPITAGSTATVTLSQGDVFVLHSAVPFGAACGARPDLTGTTIEASRNVAVFVGHECAFVPCDSPYCDHLEEQLFPTNAWGRTYVVSALRERGDSEPSVIRVLAADDGDVLTFDGIPHPDSCPAELDAGEFCELTTTDDFVLHATERTLVAQFMVGETVIAGTSGGDPSMVLEVPTFQFRTDYVIGVPETYIENFVTVVHRTGLIPLLDDVPIAAGTPVGASGYSVARFSVTPGLHRLRGHPFAIKVSGVGHYTSYLFPGGLDIAENNTLE